MKIDSSTIRLSARRHFHQEKEIIVKQEIDFSGFLDRRLGRLTRQAGLFSPGSESSGNVLDFKAAGQSDVVRMSDNFIRELEKLRQILGRILEQVNSKGLQGCCLSPANVGMVHIFTTPHVPVQRYDYEKVQTTQYKFEETEQTRFRADGVVQTADGRRIDLSFGMDLNRRFFNEEQFVKKEKGYVMIDPLVINLDATVPQFSDVRIDFDLDADGTLENIPVLASGSGYLSLDKNDDGIINDGSELFGPVSGDGFEALAQYDTDHNMWIDENDPIFDSLTIWRGDENEATKLTKIKDAGIGAIYLASVESPFDFTDKDNHLEARLKKSSIALNEDGTVSGIQEMDWTA